MRSITPLKDRFWRKVDMRSPHECWPFMGSRNYKGYGQIFLSKRGGKRVQMAHRVALLLSGHHVPDDMMVLHSCDNPCCCNPAHLRVGTAKENTAEMFERGRARQGGHVLGQDHHNAALSEEIVIAIRQSTAPATELAKVYGVLPVTIRSARRGLRYRNVKVPPLKRVWIVSGVRYESLDDAVRASGISRKSLARMCRGRSDGGYTYGPKPGFGVELVPDPNWISQMREYGKAA